jgi:DNA-directed RNA polymerase beta' subunit
MKLVNLNFDDIYNPDRVVTNHNALNKKKEYAEDGLFSEDIFGALTSDNDYGCKCRKYVGKFYNNYECDECGTKVKKLESNIEKIGWIKLGEGVYLISYIYYKFLEKLIGKKPLLGIINYGYTLQKDGIIDEDDTDEDDPYFGKGVLYLKENFEEILGYYLKKKKDKKDIYDFLLENKEYVFVDKIPIISVSLRPAIMVNNTLKFDETNVFYSNLIKENKIFDTKIEGEKLEIITNATISRMQFLLNQLSEKIIENIKGKNGFIRNSIMGTRVNYSARNVISPAKAGVKLNEIVLPYLTFLELYKFEIINVIKKVKGINFMQAERRWFDATTKMDEEVYLIIKKMVEDYDNYILLNRNPTISYGSILCLRIVEVKNDYDDLTTSLNNTILAPLSGDYDGDVLNIISIKDEETKEIMKQVFDPVRMIIDSNTLNFNDALNVERDQVLGLYSLNN